MRIKIIGDNLEITPRIRVLVKNKIVLSLEKYLPKLNQEIKTATMKIEKHTRGVIKSTLICGCQRNIRIFAKSRKENLRSALMDLREQLERQLKKYKAGLKQT